MCFEIYSLWLCPFSPHTPWQKTEPKRTMKDRKHYGTLTAIKHATIQPGSARDRRVHLSEWLAFGGLCRGVSGRLPSCPLRWGLLDGGISLRAGRWHSLRHAPRRPVLDYKELHSTSHCGGSAFTVDEADVEDHISVQPQRADFSQRLLLRSSSQVLSPLSPVIPSANPQPAITYLGSHQVLPVASSDKAWGSPVSASSHWILDSTSPCEPLSPPWLLAPSSPPWSIIPPSLWLHLGQSLTIRRLRTTLLWLHLIPPSLRLCQAPPSLWLHLRPQSTPAPPCYSGTTSSPWPSRSSVLPRLCVCSASSGTPFPASSCVSLTVCSSESWPGSLHLSVSNDVHSSVELGLVYKTFVNKHTNETPTSECNLAGGNQ